MRIIAGELKGRRLKRAVGTRPTGDRVREALFSILGGRIEGTFIDTYAGAGTVGLEARSRGARVIFVEREDDSIEALRGNIEALGDPEGVVVVASDALRFFKDPLASRRLPLPAWALLPAACVFADPPYDYPLHEKLLKTMAASALVDHSTVIVVEHRRGSLPSLRLEQLALVRCESYGESALSFFRRD